MKLWLSVVIVCLGLLVGILWFFQRDRQSHAGPLPPSSAHQASLPKAPLCTNPESAGSSTGMSCKSNLPVNVDESISMIADDVHSYLQNETALLPFETINATDIHSVLAPHYESEAINNLLVPSLRPVFEKALYEEFRWRLEGDKDAYQWRQSRIHEFLYGEPLTNPTELSPQELQEQHSMLLPGIPIQRTGFADVPLIVKKGRPLELIDKSIVAHLNEKTKKRLDKEMIVVTVQSADKITKTDRQRYDYATTSMVFLYDPDCKTPIFYPLVSTERPCEQPNAQIPAFFKGKVLSW